MKIFIGIFFAIFLTYSAAYAGDDTRLQPMNSKTQVNSDEKNMKFDEYVMRQLPGLKRMDDGLKDFSRSCLTGVGLDKNLSLSLKGAVTRLDMRPLSFVGQDSLRVSFNARADYKKASANIKIGGCGYFFDHFNLVGEYKYGEAGARASGMFSIPCDPENLLSFKKPRF